MNRSYVFGALAVLVIGVIIGAFLFFQLPDPDAPIARDDAVPGENTAESRNSGTAGAGAGGAPGVGQSASVPRAGSGEPAANGGPRVPTFDVVRVDEAGNVVIAGRAEPGCTIVVRDGETEIGRVEADRSGEWVLLPDQSLSAGERELHLFAECEGFDPIEAERVIALVVPERPDGAVVAVAVPRDGQGAAEVLQRPSLDGTSAAVGGVEYDDAGNTTITGLAAPNSIVRLYLDNELVGETRADADGRWSITLDDTVAPGSYNLRVDQIGPDGNVVARSEIPFVRSEPLRDLPPGRIVIIQPGDYLWNIARQRYGSGFQYTVIYEANREQIRDPDLIYPGQVFTLPTVN
ncbi:MAG: LysM peptidoglycan-binding domain-containing protein [Alphaproteobacteria bacterium]|nr:LysM peptidoglycan-binding domain-containing protein [Alphaproteobacteria bacterium]